MKTLLICNPVSGRKGRAARMIPRLRELAAASSGAIGLAVTKGPGHATELARTAVSQGIERVVAVGGDGTLNETAQSLLRTPAALGMVPCGSGNGLALHLRLPRNLEACLRLAIDPNARTVPIDTGTADGHPFFNAMGLGLDAEVSIRFNRLVQRGLPAYVRAVWEAYRAHRPDAWVISNGSRRQSMRCLLLAVANSDQYGNNARIAPGASVRDGELNLVAIPTLGWLAVPALATRLFLGTIDRSPGVRHWRGTHFRIERPEAGPVHTDGEVHAAAATVEVSVLPGSLRVLLPPSPP